MTIECTITKSGRFVIGNGIVFTEIEFEHSSDEGPWQSVEVHIEHTGPLLPHGEETLATVSWALQKFCDDAITALNLDMRTITMRELGAQDNGFIALTIDRYPDGVLREDHSLDFDYAPRGREIGLEINDRLDTTKIFSVEFQSYENADFITITICHDNTGNVGKFAGNVSRMSMWLQNNCSVAILHYGIDMQTLTWYGDQEVGCFKMMVR